MALEPISLGFACEVKYQLSRHLYFKAFPDGDEAEFRRMLLTPELGQRTFQRQIFDWQITPFEAVLAYLECDFQGVFERRDLVVSDQFGEVMHSRLGTRHPHEFHPIDGVLDGRAIDAQYEAARSKFEHLAERFRAALRQPAERLYVFRQIRIYDDAARLIRLLGAGHPEHRFLLLFVDWGDADQTLTALEGQVFKAWAPLQAEKPQARQWEGDDHAWDGLLAPFDLRPHPDRTITRTFDESVAGPG